VLPIVALLRPPPEGPAPPPPPVGATTTEAIEVLRPLFAAAGDLAMDDAQGWLALCRRAWRDVGSLVERGLLPRYYELRHGDPPPVVAEVVAQAWWYATTPLDLRHHRG
jgi:hypothetical protein